MVQVPVAGRWLLALTAIVLLASTAGAVSILDSSQRLPDVIHGYGGAQIEDEAYLLGGGRGSAFLDEVTVVRADGSATTAGSLSEEVLSPAAAAHDGTIYVFGGAEPGQGELPETTDEIYRFDPATGETELVFEARLPDPVAGASAVTVGDRIYVLGGLSIQPSQEDEIDFVRTIARFDPASKEVTELSAKLPTGRAQASAVEHEGEVLYIGGHAESGPGTCASGRSTCYVGDVLRLRPVAEQIEPVARLATPVRWSAAAVHGDLVYVMGGCQANCGAHAGTSAIQELDPSSGEVEQLPVTLPVTGGRNSAFVVGDVARIPGGSTGGGDHDSIVRVKLSHTPPWAPVNLTAHSVEGGVELTWEPPAYDGGDPVTGYVVERARGAREPTRLDRVTDTTYRDDNATPGVTYAYQIRAANTRGLSPAGGSELVRPTKAPDAPSVTAQGGDGKLVVQWSPPRDTGGLEVTGYRVFAYPPGGEVDLDACAEGCWGTVSNTTTRVTVDAINGTPVENGNSYDVRVQARNGNGWGNHSPVRQIEAKPVPDAPVNLRAQPAPDADERAVDLDWEAPEKDGVTGYVVYRGPSLGELEVIATTGETRVRDADEVPEGEEVFYAVSARNGGAEGPLSVPERIVFATAPGAVGDLAARWTGSHVEVTWSGPNDTGGKPIQAYEVARTEGAMDPEEAGATIHRTAVQRFQDDHPPKGKPLAYHVRAVTEAGEGPWDLEQVRVPLTQDSRPPAASLAAHPTKVEAGQRVVFDASGSRDDEDIVAYDFEFGDGSGTGWRSSPRVSHVFQEPGVFNATVTVRDVSGLEGTSEAVIAVGPPPEDDQPESPRPNGTLDDPPTTDDAPLPLAAVLAGLLAAAVAGARGRGHP